MRLFHNSQQLDFRKPFGAIPTGSKVTLSLQVEDSQGVPAVSLRLVRKDGEETLPMTQDSKTELYTVTISVGDTPQLLWYDFVVTDGTGTLYYHNNPARLGGVGEPTPHPVANSFQITVYDKDYHTPAWFRGQVMYQIFPDRFYGVHPNGEIPRKRPEYAIHYDWYEGLSNHRHPVEDGPACDDFYGGNLKGIQAKLPYLQSLGVGVLYLNPIFDAYSVHKYDTADYKTIDPMFGTEEDFADLCREAEKLGIRIILDGVFSHTGADSIYFNKYGNYGEPQGAYRDYHSPYHSWYQFTDFLNYQSWWGCSNLPNVNEMEPSYLDYILRDEDAVVKKWISRGASGWRLDVADELPDEFIQILRQEVKKANPDAVVIGEVWEDASNKTAYGTQREYLLGHELDSVMNYPFKDQVLSYLMGWSDAATLHAHILSQLENYPAQTLYSLMNILGTHDTMRVKSLLGGMDENCGTARLSSGNEELATARLRLGAFLQMTFYGVPCIYYGDEVGMEGGKDPHNRGTYPWRHIDPSLREWYQTLGNLRQNTSVLKHGYFTPVYAEGDVYAYVRHFVDGKTPFGEKGDGGFALCLVNRAFEERQVTLDLSFFGQKVLTEYFSKESLNANDTITLPPLGAKLYFG
ncbi:MAG: glycoside hydrolase family 13 protein [Clostridia bacterium]|nr:glycoside hydrolase family 13 protein [Clostridia bacterium]